MTKLSKSLFAEDSAEFSSARMLRIFFVLLAVSVLCAISGPFNTYGLGSFWARLIYWGGAIVSSWGVAELAMTVVRRIKPAPVFWREAITIAIFVPVYLPILLFWTDLAFPQQTEARYSAARMGTYILVICVTISFLRHALQTVIVRHLAPPEKETRKAPALIRRLPKGFKGKVLRLSGDGHFTKVGTTEGDFDIRMRLRDAIDEMDGVTGFSTHRSHWVAVEAIARQGTRKGRPVLILTDGTEVPVSAKYQLQLEEAGVLKAARGMATANA